jgi:hypothetical protein
MSFPGRRFSFLTKGVRDPLATSNLARLPGFHRREITQLVIPGVSGISPLLRNFAMAAARRPIEARVTR